jgi:hypothetical protein
LTSSLNVFHNNKIFGMWLIFLACLLASQGLAAQGQDSTSGQRNLLIMAELLPGAYDNVNQNYFDKRRNLPAGDRHQRLHTKISAIDAPAFGDHAYLWINTTKTEQGEQVSWRIATLSADGEHDEVTMRHYFSEQGELTAEIVATLKPEDLRRTEGCDYYFKRRASQYRGEQRAKACQFDWEGQAVYTANTIELSESELWFSDHKFVTASDERITGVVSGEPYWLERSREFHCYADIPGVGGGREIPFERYEGFTLHDKGGTHWFTSHGDEPQEIGLILQSVTWQVLNENNGNFNRNSLVLYAVEKLADGSVKEHGYAFTEPEAERIGMNMKWMLVNCSLTPRDKATPEM